MKNMSDSVLAPLRETFGDKKPANQTPMLVVCSSCRRQCMGAPEKRIAVGRALTEQQISTIDAERGVTHSLCLECAETLYGPLEGDEQHHSVDPIAVSYFRTLAEQTAA